MYAHSFEFNLHWQTALTADYIPGTYRFFPTFGLCWDFIIFPNGTWYTTLDRKHKLIDRHNSAKHTSVVPRVLGSNPIWANHFCSMIHIWKMSKVMYWCLIRKDCKVLRSNLLKNDNNATFPGRVFFHMLSWLLNFLFLFFQCDRNKFSQTWCPVSQKVSILQIREYCILLWTIWRYFCAVKLMMFT